MFSGKGISWGGYENNALLMNLEGKDFLDVAFLMGVSYQFDARCTVSGDLDGDGRIDLIAEHQDHLNNKSNLHILRNQWPAQDHWIGVHLQARGSTPSPLGLACESDCQMVARCCSTICPGMLHGCSTQTRSTLGWANRRPLIGSKCVGPTDRYRKSRSPQLTRIMLLRRQQGVLDRDNYATDRTRPTRSGRQNVSRLLSDHRMRGVSTAFGERQRQWRRPVPVRRSVKAPSPRSPRTARPPSSRPRN